MRQIIQVNASGANTGSSLNILFVHQVKDEIYVLLENDSAGAGGDMVISLNKQVSVNAAARHELPVKFFIVNSEDNQIFTLSGFTGVHLQGTDKPELLTSVYDYLFKVKGEKCLYENRPHTENIRALAKELNDKPDQKCDLPEDIIQRFSFLDRSAVRHLIRQQPCSIPMLKFMDKAGLFTIDSIVSHHFFAKLMRGLHAIDQDKQQKMLTLFTLLDNGADGKSLLTPFICDAIMADVFELRDYNLVPVDGFIRFVEQMSPLSAQIATIFFLEPYRLLLVHDTIHSFDPSGESERYAYAHATGFQVSGLCGWLDGCTWMTKEVFRYLVDNIEDIFNVMNGLSRLQRFNMLATHLDAFKNNRKASEALREIENLTEADVVAALKNTEFHHVISWFSSLYLIGQWAFNADKNEVNTMLKTILHSQELTQAVFKLKERYTLAKEELHKDGRGIPFPVVQAFNDGWVKEMKALIAASNVKNTAAFNLFQPVKSTTDDAAVQKDHQQTAALGQ